MYEITLEESNLFHINVDAKDKEEAIKLAKEIYNDGNIYIFHSEINILEITENTNAATSKKEI